MQTSCHEVWSVKCYPRAHFKQDFAAAGTFGWCACHHGTICGVPSPLAQLSLRHQVGRRLMDMGAGALRAAYKEYKPQFRDEQNA